MYTIYHSSFELKIISGIIHNTNANKEIEFIYNRFQNGSTHNKVQNEFSSVDVMLKVKQLNKYSGQFYLILNILVRNLLLFA